MAAKSDARQIRPGLIPWLENLDEIPWWGLILLLTGILVIFTVFPQEKYREALDFVIPGLRLTIVMALATFAIAIVLGLFAGLGRVSKNPVIYTIASLYVNTVRGVPMLVLVLYFAFVGMPLMVELMNWLGSWLSQYDLAGSLDQLAQDMAALSIRNVDMTIRGIAALAFSYGAFEAEIYRAGIQAISKGQMEAARSLGMSYVQAMRVIILPQAIRIILPPMANDFIAVVKDTSLLSAIGVAEMTQLAKIHRASTFRTFEVWNTVTFLYLVLIFMLQIFAKFVEKRMARE